MITLNAFSPSPETPSGPKAPITVLLGSNNGPITSVFVWVNGAVAYEYAPSDSPRVWFDRPHFFGDAQYTDTTHVVEVVPRRPFLRSTAVTVSVVAQDADGSASFTVTYYIADAVGAARSARLNTNATLPPGLAALAQQLRGTYLPVGVLFEDALLYGVKGSQLLPLLLELAPGLADVSGVLAAPSSVLSADAALRAVEVAWEPAREELVALGWPPADLDVFARSLAAPYPQERVGAACGMVLLAYATP